MRIFRDYLRAQKAKASQHQQESNKSKSESKSNNRSFGVESQFNCIFIFKGKQSLSWKQAPEIQQCLVLYMEWEVARSCLTQQACKSCPVLDIPTKNSKLLLHLKFIVERESRADPIEKEGKKPDC